MAAVKQLEESMPPELLEEDAEWFQAWKASGYDQEVYMPYFKQLDNKTAHGHQGVLFLVSSDGGVFLPPR